MEGLGFPFFIFLAWIFFSLFRQATQKAGGTGKPRPPRLPRDPDAGQGATFDFFEVLRELERARSEQARPQPLPDAMPRRAPGARLHRLPISTDEEAAFRDESSAGDLELARGARSEVSLDQASEEVARRRREAVELRERPRTPADHAAFDARIRQEAAPEPEPGVAQPGAARLRAAFVWSELLGPPKALRDD